MRGFFLYLACFTGLNVGLASAIAPVAIAQPAPPAGSLCPAPALDRVIQHRVASGETVASIAAQYNLIPATLLGMNPSLRGSSPAEGSSIAVPPYNGIRVEVPAGSTWRDLARSYGVRADLLFEINGCQAAPSVVFVPGINWSPTASTAPAASSDFVMGYPLPETAPLLRDYGWQLDPGVGEVVFNSGVDLQATSGTAVLAAASGVVAFAGPQADYGILVVINHAQGLQTRYAQLASFSVQVGQSIAAGSPIGTTGSSNRLQFEVRSNSSLGWVAQDPSRYVPNLGANRLDNSSPPP